LATQPTAGAPIVILPKATPTRSAITLPRMDGSVASTLNLFWDIRIDLADKTAMDLDVSEMEPA
jgi:hypothetical protein